MCYIEHKLRWTVIQVSDCIFIVCSGLSTGALFCSTVWASTTDPRLNQRQNQELFILQPPQTSIVLPDCCWKHSAGGTPGGSSFQLKCNCAEYIVLVPGGDNVSNHGSDISTRFCIHKNDISTSADGVSTHGSAMFTHWWHLWPQQWPTVIQFLLIFLLFFLLKDENFESLATSHPIVMVGWMKSGSGGDGIRGEWL